MTRPNEPHSQPDHPATLVRSVLAGETGSFERMVRDYTPMLLARLRAKVSDAFEQQDLLQEVFLTAHRRLGALRQPERLGAWLGRIADRLAVSWQRRRFTQPVLAGLGFEEEVPAAIAEDTSHIRALVGAAYRTLSRDHRDVVFQHYARGRSYQQTALALGITPDLVRSRLQKARAKIQTHYIQMQNQDPSILTIPPADLQLLQQASRHCFTGPEKRPALQGILLEPESGRLIATDGRRLLMRRRDWIRQVPERLVLGEMAGLQITGAGEGRLAVGMAEATLECAGQVQRIFPLNPAPFPQYEQVLGGGFTTKFTVATHDLEAASHRLRTLAPKADTTTPLLLAVRESVLLLRLTYPEGSREWTHEVRIPVDPGSADELSVQLDLRYFEEALAALTPTPDGRLRLAWGAAQQVVRMSWLDDEEQQALIMPMVVEGRKVGRSEGLKV